MRGRCMPTPGRKRSSQMRREIHLNIPVASIRRATARTTSALDSPTSRIPVMEEYQLPRKQSSKTIVSFPPPEYPHRRILANRIQPAQMLKLSASTFHWIRHSAIAVACRHRWTILMTRASIPNRMTLKADQYKYIKNLSMGIICRQPPTQHTAPIAMKLIMPTMIIYPWIPA